MEKNIAYPTDSALLEKMRGQLVEFMQDNNMLQQSETLTGVEVKTSVVDLGYRGQHTSNADVIHRGRKLSKRQKRRLRRRAALEAMIGHMKVDGLLERCHLKGLDGDAIHAILCGVGHNLRQMRAHWMRRLLWLWISCLHGWKSRQIASQGRLAA